MAKKRKKKNLKKRDEKIESEEVKEKINKVKEDKGIQKYVGVFAVGLVLGLIVGIALLSSLSIEKQSTLTAEEAGQKAVDWISNYAVRPGTGVELINVTELKDAEIYRLFINLSVGNVSQVVQSYITKDGKYLFPQGIPTGEFAALKKKMEQEQQNKEQEQKLEIPKTDKPEVELFVMTYCPYGAQAEKGIIPTIKALGNTIDAKIRFVHYFMHGDIEDQETHLQLCIREEQSDKYLTYLECFLADGNSTRCLEEAKIDENKLNSCVSNGKADEYYAKDSELSKGYGVSGSPTLVVNGVVTVSNSRYCPSGKPCAVYSGLGRSPAAYLDTICSAFNNPPEECNQKLSESTPSPGFGYSVGSSSSGGCRS